MPGPRRSVLVWFPLTSPSASGGREISPLDIEDTTNLEIRGVAESMTIDSAPIAAP